MAKILVTGGKGFIGTNLTEELRKRGHEVWTCDLVPGEDARHYKLDVGSFRQLEAALETRSFDYVYHLAAEYGRHNGEDHYENLWRTNVVGTKHILNLQAQYRFRLVFFSSAEVYGEYDGVMKEDVMDDVPIKQINDYAISKWAGEQQCLNQAAKHGTDIVRVRPVGCYGPHEFYNPYRGVIPIFVYRSLTGQPFTSHRGHRRIFDYVDDTCRTFANIADNFIPGEVYNVGGKEDWDVSIEELANMVIEITGCDASLMKPENEEQFTTLTKIVDFSKARRDLGHDPQVSLEQGLRRYADWMREVYNIN
jgi:dTDP-glucose 4,6-dehydratase